MSPSELTAILTAVTAAIAAVLVPLYLARRARQEKNLDRDVVSWQGITAVLQRERDELAAKVRTVEKDCETKIADAEQTWSVKLEVAKERIAALEAEVLELHRRLYQGPPRP